MENVKCLPVLLVSAKDKVSAVTVISEIIDKQFEDVASSDLDYVWRITNKYYTADVRVQAFLDGDDPGVWVDSVEGHVIYLNRDECGEVAAVETMQARMAAARAAPLRLVVAEAARDPPRLAAAVTAARVTDDAPPGLVPLRARAEPELREPAGAERLRAALHAHLWPGLRRRPAAGDADQADEAGSSDDEWSEWRSGPGGADAEAAAEAERRFAAGLARLGGAAAAARAAGGAREERLARAEQLVAAFCRALGTPLD